MRLRRSGRTRAILVLALVGTGCRIGFDAQPAPDAGAGPGAPSSALDAAGGAPDAEVPTTSVLCSPGEDCRMQATPGSELVVACAPGQLCQVHCVLAASCIVDCTGASTCIVACPASDCLVTGCTGGCSVGCGDLEPPSRLGDLASCP